MGMMMPMTGFPRPQSTTLSILHELKQWCSASKSEQDRAIAAIARGLGFGYFWLGTECYECCDRCIRIATFRHERSGIELNLIPGGTFLMGSAAGERDEQPVHEVHVEPFLIGRTPVSQECWDMVGGEDERPWHDVELPISGISWFDAQDWLIEASDGLRLPSEAEWEYACRATTQTHYFWGDDPDDSYFWFGGNAYTCFRSHPAWEHEDKPNAFGLIDTSGNVFEWCEDNWFGSYNSAPATQHPRVGKPGNSDFRVLRGGSWNDHCDRCCSWFRYRALPGDANPDYGLRVARSLPIPYDSELSHDPGVNSGLREAR